MTNKYDAVMEFIKTCPLVGCDTYFNFIDQTNTDGNTSLMTVPFGQVVKTYVDGMKLKKFQCEIRKVMPLSQQSNTTQNIEQIQAVQDFINWINEQGRKKNFPDFGDECTVQRMETSGGAEIPSIAGYDDNSALYAFPFEILYTERK